MLSTPKAKAELFLASSLYDGLEDNNIMQVTTLLLSKEADPNVLIPSQGITPFHLVIGNDSETFAEEVTKLFLRHGGNPNVKSVDGMTPVHVAAAWGRLGVLELLLSNGGDPLLVDDDGRCPFHYAFDEAHYDAVATLGKYCGESFEVDTDPKYNIALDKILVSNGSIVAEYAVSEDTFATAASDVPAIRTGNTSNNNNDFLENLNQHSGYMAKAEDHDSNWHARCPANIDLTITTTADETSTSMPGFINTRRHRRCLPRRNREHIEYQSKYEDKVGHLDPDLPEENLPALSIGMDNRRSITHLNDPVIEASFLIQPRKVGENMPRVSSPKTDEKSVKLGHDTGTEYRDVGLIKTIPRENKKAGGKNKFVHKTPLRCCSKRVPLVEAKKTPAAVVAKKVYNLNTKTTPNNKKFLANDNRELIHTPNKYSSKQCSYSPDCSIVSKSPNLILAPLTPTNNYKPREERRSTGVSSARKLKRIPAYGSNYKTPTPDKICNTGQAGKSFSRFVKQSDLRHQGTKTTPVSSPSRFRDSPTWSKKLARTPNLTDSTKQKKKCSNGRTKTVIMPPYSTACVPANPLNKTYSKNKYFDAASLSPDIETTNRFVDRRSLAKNIAIKLEETMYDFDCDVNEGEATVTTNLEYPVTVQPELSSAAEKRSTCLNKRINADHSAFKEGVEISGVNMIADSTKISEDGTTGIQVSGFYSNTRDSNIIAGFFRPGDIDHSFVKMNNANEIMNNAITVLIPRSYSKTLAGNFPRTENFVNPTMSLPNHKNNMPEETDEAACFKRPNSKEIDDSLVSSDPSGFLLDNYTTDPTGSLNLCNMEVSVETGMLLTDSSARCNEISKSESSPGRLRGEHYPGKSEKICTSFPNVRVSVDGSSYESFVSMEEEYKYQDPEQGIVLLERRFLITPVSIPIIKTEDGVPSLSAKSSQCLDDESMESCVSSLPHSLVIMDSETLRRELTKLNGHPPGPITATTRHVYLKRLRKLQKYGPAPPSSTIAVQPKFSAEIERTLRSESWTNDLSSYDTLEQQVFSEFSNPDPTRRWREGTTKSSFNYLLMDPRITDNLPRRATALSSSERWRTFLSSIFYIGKGRRSRPYAHLYEAYGEWKKGKKDTNDKKVNCILDIWKSNCGVVCLHLFQNTIPVEAYTREAAMIEALGLDRLKNSKSGDYYGVAATWSQHQKRTLGVYLLYRAMHILINEGERQLSPDDIGR